MFEVLLISIISIYDWVKKEIFVPFRIMDSKGFNRSEEEHFLFERKGWEVNSRKKKKTL
jgi:hypothetical protein